MIVRWGFIAVLALGLGGCPGTRVVTETRIDVQPVPDYLRSCKPRPSVPAPPRTQRTVARIVVQLDERGEDCAAKLKALVDLTDATITRVQAFNQQQSQR